MDSYGRVSQSVIFLRFCQPVPDIASDFLNSAINHYQDKYEDEDEAEDEDEDEEEDEDEDEYEDEDEDEHEHEHEHEDKDESIVHC